MLSKLFLSFTFDKLNFLFDEKLIHLEKQDNREFESFFSQIKQIKGHRGMCYALYIL